MVCLADDPSGRRLSRDGRVDLSFWVWWLVPLAATIVALVFVGFRARPGRPADPGTGMAELERFREAMTRPLPREGRVFVTRDDRDDDTGELPAIRDNWSK